MADNKELLKIPGDCHHCRITGVKNCEFALAAYNAAENVPELPTDIKSLNQEQLNKARKNAEIAHQIIYDYRVIARGYNCLHLNHIDPDYPGRRLI